jgi:hypothetical protein
MKKLAATIITLSILAMPMVSMADTTASTTVSANASVQALLTQIQALQAQIQALKTAQTQVQTAANNVGSTLQLIRSLKQGMSGDDVKALQAILAADPTLYQGNITGFFGPLTAEGVKKFQKKFGIETVGSVGPKTLRKLNEEMDHLGLSKENDDNQGDKDHGKSEQKLCIPPGHMIAPGWLKHNEKPVPTALIPLCNDRKDGDRDEHNGDHNASTTPTLTTNASAQVQIGGMIHDTAHLSGGNAPTGVISFKVYGPNDTACATPLTPGLESLIVSGNKDYISPNFQTTAIGTYRFVATYSGDAKNKSVTTSCSDANEVVNVTPVVDQISPVISSVVSSSTSNGAVITWTTNENADSKVWFGTTNPLVLGASVSNSSMVTSHSATITGQATSTTLFYVVVSKDGSGNTATSTQSSFTTLSL